MKSRGNITLGVCLVLLGSALLGNFMGLFNINVFFNGWWTLLIIIPSMIGLFTKDNKFASIVGLIVGISLLLSQQKIIPSDLIWKIALAVGIIALGIKTMFRKHY